MLGGKDDGTDADDLVAIVVFERNLRFGVGLQPRKGSLPQILQQPVGQPDGKRHVFAVKTVFFFGIAEHNALVAGAAVFDAGGDVGRLAVQQVGDLHVFITESGLIITDRFYQGADGIFNFFRLRTVVAERFSGDDDPSGRRHGFDRRVSRRISGQKQIKQSIRNLVADFVRMAGGNRFAGEKVTHCQVVPVVGGLSFSDIIKSRRGKRQLFLNACAYFVILRRCPDHGRWWFLTW